MSKYIVEIKPEYEDSFKGLMILAVKDNDLEELNSDYINEHYGNLQDEAYQRGLTDAWECMKKIAFLEKPRDMRDFFGHITFEGILNGYTATEAIAKLKAYEEQKADDEIKVGDEMKQVTESGTETGLRCTVTAIDGDRMNGISQDGRAIVCSSQVNRWWKKTGRHFDIDKILVELRHEP